MKVLVALVAALGIVAMSSAAMACPWSSADSQKDTPTVGS